MEISGDGRVNDLLRLGGAYEIFRDNLANDR